MREKSKYNPHKDAIKYPAVSSAANTASSLNTSVGTDKPSPMFKKQHPAECGRKVTRAGMRERAAFKQGLYGPVRVFDIQK